jgi:large subunit ribosomal protein L21
VRGRKGGNPAPNALFEARQTSTKSAYACFAARNGSGGAEGRGTKDEEPTMYAVIKTGGKQYRVSADDVIEIEKIDGEAGAKITFGDVLMVGDEGQLQVGKPLVAGAAVEAEVIEQKKAPTIIVFKKIRRQNYRRRNGHRQPLTKIRILGIKA